VGYYMGDYYAGSRGDPGIGSFLLGGLKSAVGMIPGVGGALSSIIPSGVKMVERGGAAATAGRVLKAGKGIIMKHPVLTAAGAAGIGGALLGAGGEKLLGGGRRCKHINPRTGKCRRRMNVCNPRALRRSIRRTHGFAKLAMRTIHLVHPKKKARFGGFRKKKAHR
jgi:hypothetical protein